MKVIISAISITGGGYFNPIKVSQGNTTYKFNVISGKRVYISDVFGTLFSGYISAPEFHAIVSDAKRVGGRITYV